ncbi:unnamed protein product [Blepharisma stoltei]|uniref:Protein kinase domain-containing protein n=1 Tax=Blepharisma stoltei TaxID=1481888 RepID=A0AAU9J0B4_9CILI|nr:unnamed protein product [Blepharisma stoltei]
MRSIFEKINTQHENSFWKKSENSNDLELEKIIYQGKLTELKSSGKLKEKFFSLSSKYLFSAKSENSKPDKQATIRFRTIDPFVEETKNSINYGFQILWNHHTKYFYTNSSHELDNWLDSLAAVGIMTKVEDDYEILKILGSGSYATVYLSRDLCTNKEFAIKAIDKSLIKGKNIYFGMINEIEILRNLDHPNIIKLHRVYESDTHIYLVLDYIKGGNLLSRLHARGPISEKQSKKFMEKLLGLLNYLEERDIVHRDIKLENILLTSDTKISDFKLIDFGFSEILQDKSTAYCGTPGYMAPEILKNIPYGLKVDIFSAGIILYMILSNQAPFCGDSENEMIESNKQGSIVFDSKHFMMISPDSIRVIMEMTNSDPSSRPSAKELLRLRWFTKEKLSQKFKRIHIHEIHSELSNVYRRHANIGYTEDSYGKERNELIDSNLIFFAENYHQRIKF